MDGLSDSGLDHDLGHGIPSSMKLAYGLFRGDPLRPIFGQGTGDGRADESGHNQERRALQDETTHFGMCR